MEPTALRFWGIMSLASLVGAALAYPVNWWLVKSGLKHGMGTERALGKGGTKVAAARARLSTAAVRLATGVTLSALYGDLSMRAGEIHEMPMSMPMPN